MQFVTNFRLIVENLLKYGLLLKFDGALWTSWRAWPCCSTLLGTQHTRHTATRHTHDTHTHCTHSNCVCGFGGLGGNLAMNAFIVVSYCLERYMAAEAKKPALKVRLCCITTTRAF